MKDLLVPNPLISRGKPVFTSSGGGAVATGGLAAVPTWRLPVSDGSASAWVALGVGPGAKRVLVSWAVVASSDSAGGSDGGVPTAYRIESSADSRDGRDGTWRVEVTVADNAVAARAHSFEFDGQSWVRWVVTAVSAGAAGVKLERFDVHDASDGSDDTWLFWGSGIKGAAFESGGQGAHSSFAQEIYALYPGYFPAVINAGGGAALTPAAACAQLDALLSLYPDFRHFAFGFSFDDLHTQQVGAARFRTELQELVTRLLGAGRHPIVARIPPRLNAERDGVTEYNGVIDDLTREHGLLVGPDLDRGFGARLGQLSAGVQAGTSGSRAILRLWVEAVDALYAPQ